MSNAPAISCTYLITAHTQPKAVARLAETLVRESKTARVFIHFDAKAGPFPVDLIASTSRISVASRPVAVRWATFSQVEAVLESLKEMRSNPGLPDWVVLISGQDYPARNITDLETMLATCGRDAIFTYDRITAADRHLFDRYAFSYRRISESQLPRLLRAGQLYDQWFNRSQPIVRIQTGPRGTFVGRRSRSIMDAGIPVYKGWLWFALSRAAIDAILKTLEIRPDFVAKFASTLSPDESFFQTLILNTPGLTSINAQLHYADWTQNQSSPRFLTMPDLPAIVSSQQWFARKIDGVDDGGLRDALDRLRSANPSDSRRE